MTRVARLIAFYLPQFHPIPENDQWWGKGFTEWTNVVRARPLFRGHYQPRIPADLGFYDLRVPETRAAQAEMARQCGIEAFCYWHYWFAGKRLLERPFQEVLRLGEPNFPFCLAWANDTWTGIWYGSPTRVLIEQTYPGMKDHENHFYALLPAFADDRYLTVDGKKLFLVYWPYELPEPRRFTDFWRDLAVREGLKGFYFIGIADKDWVPGQYGFDAVIEQEPNSMWSRLPERFADKLCRQLTGQDRRELHKRLRSIPTIYNYQELLPNAILNEKLDFDYYPCVVPNWDNTARSGLRGVVFHESTPDLYQIVLRKAIERVMPNRLDKRLVFIKSWNEWAEGNYLEPDHRFGRAHLEVTKTEAARSEWFGSRMPAPNSFAGGTVRDAP